MATITKRGDTYRIRVSAGYDISGKQIMKSITWKPEPGMTKKQIEKELERQTVLFEEKVRSGRYIGDNIKLADFAELWLNDYGKEHLKATTYKNYSDRMKRIIAALGHMHIGKVQPHHIIEFYENLAEDGIREDIKYKSTKDIGAYLKSHKLTQKALAEQAAVSEGTIRSLVHGHNISKPTAEKVCSVLNKPLTELFAPVTENNKLTGSTILYYHHVLSSMFQTAVYWQVITDNPCDRVKAPKAEHKEAIYLDEKQAQELIDKLNDEPLIYRTLLTVVLLSGMRRGEVCGLTWDDIDFKHNLIDINKNSLYLSSRGIFDDTTKTEASKRVINLPAEAVSLLKEYRTEQNKQRLQVGEQWIDTGKVFTQWNGKPIHPDSVTGWFHDFIERTDLPKIHLHSLRHTNATLMIANGVDIKTVSKRLGHANITTTGNIYTHAIKTADERAAETLGSIITIKKA